MRNFWIACGFIFLCSCVKAPKAKYSDLQYEGLFKPAFIDFSESDTIEFLPIPDELNIDSIHSEFYNLRLVNSVFQCVKTSSNAPSLSNCVVYQDGIPLGLPLYRGNPNTMDKSAFTWMESDRSYLYLKLEAPKEVLAYWNNLRVEISNLKDTFKITIPPFAKYTENSHISVFMVDSSGKLDQAVVPLRKGKIVRELSKLRKPMVEDGLTLSLPHLMKLSDVDFQPIIQKFADAELRQPSSLAGIYGQYSIVAEDSNVVVIKARYFDQISTMYFNKSKNKMERIGANDSTIWIGPYSAVSISGEGSEEIPHQTQ